MLDSDIRVFHAAEVSSNPTNGGRRSYNEVISGVINNVWPHVPKAERTAGSELIRFLYVMAADDSDGTLISAEDYIDAPTDGDDYVVAFEMPYGSTQADVTGNERKYGAASISSDITSGVSTFDVTVEDVALATGTQAIFVVGDKGRLTNKVTPDAVSGTEEELTVSGVSNVDTVVTVTVNEAIANAYTTAEGSRFSSVMERGDVKTSEDNYVVSTAGDGDYDHASYPLVLDNLGTEQDSLTFTFTDATHFTCVGSSGTNYGSGDTGTNFSPTNANVTKPYFTLEFAGFSGTWAGGDTLTSDITEATFLFGLKRVVPPACASLANNKVTTVTIGESDQ